MLAGRVAHTSAPSRRRTGVSFIVFVLLTSVIITYFLFHCLCASDWSEELLSLQTNQMRFCVGVTNREESSSGKSQPQSGTKAPPDARSTPRGAREPQTQYELTPSVVAQVGKLPYRRLQVGRVSSTTSTIADWKSAIQRSAARRSRNQRSAAFRLQERRKIPSASPNPQACDHPGSL